ncbi:MAG: methyltransferase [Opitutales bacterium]|nr:methyltransferase [Opitutales bacterium]MCH8540002.1 methyltransferase [Opitutales bacterium]
MKITDPQGDRLLQIAARGEESILRDYRARHRQGEPAAYIAGFLIFRGRRFAVDSRAYVTDPELTHLLEQVLREGDRLERTLQRPPRLAEFGIGAGTLAITIALERPHWSLTGLEIDVQALALAAENAQSHQVRLRLWESDFLSGWPSAEEPPDLLYGDPPWGTEHDLYDEERDHTYYQHMPYHSVFPSGNSRTGMHEKLVAEVVRSSWGTLLLLNCGILPPDEIQRFAEPLSNYRIIEPEPNLRLLRGVAVE